MVSFPDLLKKLKFLSDPSRIFHGEQNRANDGLVPRLTSVTGNESTPTVRHTLAGLALPEGVLAAHRAYPNIGMSLPLLINNWSGS